MRELCLKGCSVAEGSDSLLIDYGLVAIILVSLEAVMSSRVEIVELDMPLAAFDVSDILRKLRTNASGWLRVYYRLPPRFFRASGAGN